MVSRALLQQHSAGPSRGQSWRKDGRDNRSVGQLAVRPCTEGRCLIRHKYTSRSMQQQQTAGIFLYQLRSWPAAEGVARDDSKPQQHNSFERGKHEPMSKAKMASSWRSIPNKESLQHTASSASAALAPCQLCQLPSLPLANTSTARQPTPLLRIRFQQLAHTRRKEEDTVSTICPTGARRYQRSQHERNRVREINRLDSAAPAAIASYHAG
ncbi:hypothetical protein DL89DRAFT_62750 [Linderina pennispora]|uniref:Uncharacterized protein n=1 Tax=Linderina pennispora TaxID=61395 RepID=A0A1Y1VT33_9FUNG|nr:uncharacterized protein DL89DRAFT_62750 [Linderina pennispora]ORX63904.1 hypothetical protein DL89DRAFT_62750 [Linderina pennispora]